MNSKYQEERYRPPYYLLTGLILGLILGFALTIYIFPVKYANVPPETLQTVDKDQYRLMIAYAFHANHDIGRANARLGLLREDNYADIILNQAQRSERRSDAQILLNLYEELQKETENQTSESLAPTKNVTSELSKVSSTDTPDLQTTISATIQTVRTATVVPTQRAALLTPIPTQTAVVSNTIPFQLIEQNIICNPNNMESQIQIEVLDKDNNPMENVRVFIRWEGGQDIFYTGYFPEISVGYADFLMDPNISYSVQIGEIGETVSQISAPECKDDSDNIYKGSLSLLFGEP